MAVNPKVYQYQNSADKTVILDITSVNAIDAINASVTRVLAGGITYQLQVTYADLKAIIAVLPGKLFAEYTQTNGKLAFINLQAVTVASQLSATTTTISLVGINYQVTVAVATVKTSMEALSGPVYLAASEVSDGVTFSNAAGAQSKTASFALDRTYGTLGTMVVRVDPNFVANLPPNVTAPQVSIGEDDEIANLVFSYTGAGAPIGSQNVECQILANGSVVKTVGISLEITA